MVSHVFSKRYSKISCRQYHWGLCGLCGQSLLKFLLGHRAIRDFENQSHDADLLRCPGFAFLDGGYGQWGRLILDVGPSHVFLYQTICR